MSDHPKEADRNLKRIYICDDIYLDVFHLLTPAKVGLEMALVSDTFDALVDTQFKNRKWTLGKLDIYSEYIVKKNNDGTTQKRLPFPPKPLPNSIVGFARVNICCNNSADAIAFLRCIGRLFVSDVYLKLLINGEHNWNTFATSVWPLLNVSAVIKIYFVFSSDFQNFRRLTSPSILRDCSNLRMITFNIGQFLAFPPDDSKGSSGGQALCKWLLTPRADGRPKMLKCWWNKMDALKTIFLNATTSVNFIICLYSSITSVGPFELINSLTREQLTSKQIDTASDWWMIERSPIDKCAKQWAKWEKEAMDDGTNDWKVLTVFYSN